MKKLILLFAILTGLVSNGQTFEFECGDFFSNHVGKKFQGVEYDDEEMTEPFNVGIEITDNDVILSADEDGECYSEGFSSYTTTLTITENAVTYYLYAGDGDTSLTPFTFSVVGDKLIAPNLDGDLGHLELDLVDDFTLKCDGVVTVNIDGEGVVNSSVGSYEAGTLVTIAATPNAGWSFVGWSGDIASTDNPIVIEVTSDIMITAVFKEDE